MNPWEKKCTKCGKSFSGIGDVCPDCTRTASAEAMAASQFSIGGASMFEDSMRESVPKTIEECTAQDGLTRNLWSWAINLEKYGAVLLVIILVGGLISAFMNARSVTNMAGAAEFSVSLFIASFINTIIYAVLEYLVYHVLALLVGSLAKIVQSTRTTARLAEWEARNRQ